jgi:hypothetical protein
MNLWINNNILLKCIDIILIASKDRISIDQQITLGRISIDYSHNVHKKDKAFLKSWSMEIRPFDTIRTKYWASSIHVSCQMYFIFNVYSFLLYSHILYDYYRIWLIKMNYYLIKFIWRDARWKGINWSQ